MLGSQPAGLLERRRHPLGLCLLSEFVYTAFALGHVHFVEADVNPGVVEGV